MANGKNLNIQFPFKESPKGYYVDLTIDSKSAIKSNLMHLILTAKGTRYMMPSFGTNLLKFIFEPNDTLSNEIISQDIKDTVKKYLSKLQITKVDVVQSDISEYTAQVTISYVVTDNVFEESDFIIINL